MMNYIIAVCLGIGLAAFLKFVGLLLFKILPQAFHKRRQQEYMHRREGDRRKLSSYEKQLRRDADTLLKKGDLRNASQVYEQLGMYREAINVLEKGGHVADAARILIRMRRPGRAGEIFKKHGHWQEAANCFVSGALWADAAQLYKEHNEWAKAADCLERAGQLLEAATYYERAGNFRKAAQLHLDQGEFLSAIAHYEKFIAEGREAATRLLTIEEVQELMRYIVEGNLSVVIIDALHWRERTVDVLQELLRQNRLKHAMEACLRYPPEYLSELPGKIAERDQRLIPFLGEVLRLAGLKDHRVQVPSSSPSAPPVIREEATRTKEHIKRKPSLLVQKPEESSLIAFPPGGDFSTFRDCPFFSSLDPSFITSLWDLGVTESHEDLGVILNFNDDPKGIYVILSGGVACYRMLGARPFLIDNIGTGASFGELWVLTDMPTSVKFVADGKTRIRVIDRDNVHDLLSSQRLMAEQLYKHYTKLLFDRLLTYRNQRQG